MVHVVAALPWKDIITVLPSLVTTANRLWEQLKSQPHPEPVDPHDDPQKQIAALLQRIETLENSQVVQAELMKQMTEQLQSVSAGLAEISRRYLRLFQLTVGSLILGGVALVTAFIIGATI